MRDVPTSSWSLHVCEDTRTCAGTTTGNVRRLVQTWEARNGHSQTREALAQPGAAASVGDEISWDAMRLGDPSLVSHAPQREPHWREDETHDAVDDADGPCTTPLDLANAVQGTACWSCLASLRTAGMEWRMCRCGANYCTLCAGGPCWSCGAAIVFGVILAGGSFDDGDDVGDEDQTILCTQELNVGPARCTLSVDDALARRWCLMEARAKHRQEEKVRYRAARKEQMKYGRRPARPRNRKDHTSFITTNVSSFNTFKEELTYGYALKGANFLFLQEHKLQGEDRQAAIDWLQK